MDKPAACGRPFYGEYAWAYDLLIDRPVSKECSTIATWLAERGVLPRATVLDAGCGTGRYARELARRGYVVTGVDRSPDLIAEAKRSCVNPPGSVSFMVGDLMTLATSRYHAVLCRGVLNDFVDVTDRESAVVALGRALRPHGVVVLDVRDWEATVQRKTREPLFTKRVTTDRGVLTFTSATTLDSDNRRLVIAERHTLTDPKTERSSDYQFVMQCWTRDELESGLRGVGFSAITFFGAFNSAIQVGVTDRLVAIAQL